MPVFVWILGDHRAVPVNYRHVHINEALLDWIFPGSNYSRLVTAAADDAGGRAFVTDFAGSSEVMDQRLYPEGLYDIDRLRGIEEAPELLDALRSQRFPQDNQMQALLRRHLPMSKRVLEEGVLQVIFKGDRQAYDQAAEEGWLLSRAESWFYGNMRDFAEYMEGDEYDLKALLDELEAVVVEPLRAAQELFEEYPYLTRLYTTLSVEEMTLAPMFDFNPDLPGVLRERRATGSIDCYVEDGGNQREWTEWTLVLELSDGRVVRTQPWVDSPPVGTGCRPDRAAGHLGAARDHPAANPSWRRSVPQADRPVSPCRRTSRTPSTPERSYPSPSPSPMGSRWRRPCASSMPSDNRCAWCGKGRRARGPSR